MSYLARPDDAQPQSGDQKVHEEYKIVETSNSYQGHQDAVNLFLDDIKALTTHVCYVRSIDTTLTKTQGNKEFLYSAIWFTAVGDPTPPVY